MNKTQNFESHSKNPHNYSQEIVVDKPPDYQGPALAGLVLTNRFFSNSIFDGVKEERSLSSIEEILKTISSNELMVRRVLEQCLAFKEQDGELKRAVNPSNEEFLRLKDGRKSSKNLNNQIIRGNKFPSREYETSNISYSGIAKQNLHKENKIEAQAQLLRNVIPKLGIQATDKENNKKEKKILKKENSWIKIKPMKDEHIDSYLEGTIKKTTSSKYDTRHCLAYFKFEKKGNRTITHSKEFLAKKGVNLRNVPWVNHVGQYLELAVQRKELDRISMKIRSDELEYQPEIQPERIIEYPKTLDIDSLLPESKENFITRMEVLSMKLEHLKIRNPLRKFIDRLLKGLGAEVKKPKSKKEIKITNPDVILLNDEDTTTDDAGSRKQKEENKSRKVSGDTEMDETPKTDRSQTLDKPCL
jgi:hypothetical protein